MEPDNDFDTAWQEKVDAGWKYGRDALENVRVGWDMAKKYFCVNMLDGAVKFWTFSGRLMRFEGGKIIDEIEHLPVFSWPSQAVVLYTDYARVVNNLRHRLMKETNFCPPLEAHLGITREELDKQDVDFFSSPTVLKTIRESHPAGIVRAVSAIALDLMTVNKTDGGFQLTTEHVQNDLRTLRDTLSEDHDSRAALEHVIERLEVMHRREKLYERMLIKAALDENYEAQDCYELLKMQGVKLI